MNKRLHAVFYLSLIILLLSWLFSQVGGKGLLVPGSKLPDIEYKTKTGPALLKHSGTPFIIVYFNTLCEHCRYQLTVFNEDVNTFNNISVYFLSSQSDLFQTDFDREWVNLMHHNNIIFGIIPKDSFNELFGSAKTPSLYFFDRNGILSERILGEAKASKIIEISKSLMSGRTQSRQ